MDRLNSFVYTVVKSIVYIDAKLGGCEKDISFVLLLVLRKSDSGPPSEIA
jgi:hypothetical protein